MSERQEIFEMLDKIKPGIIPHEVKMFLAGWIQGYMHRYRAAERERVLAWFAERAPQLVEAYRDRELIASPCRGDDE